MKLWYMHKLQCLAEIEVDFETRAIEYTIKHFDSLWSPFQWGDPTFEDFEWFLETRCFPRARHNLKEILTALNMDHYDPWLIVKHTHGTVANEPCWFLFDTDTGILDIPLSGGTLYVDAEEIKSSIN